MHKGLMAVLCWIWVMNAGFAQTDSQAVTVPVNEFYLKLNPLSVLETQGGIGVSAEYIFVKQKLGIQLEAQPILFSIYKNYESEEPANTIASGAPLGIELRPEVRYYFEGMKSKKNSRRILYQPDGMPLLRRNEARTYAAVDFLYKYTQVERLGTFTINNGGTTIGYNQNAVYKDVKQVVGFDIKLGTVFSISKYNKWFMEFFAGIGYRSKSYSFKNLPVGASESTRGGPIRLFGGGRLIDDTNEKVYTISLPVTIKILRRL